MSRNAPVGAVFGLLVLLACSGETAVPTTSNFTPTTPPGITSTSAGSERSPCLEEDGPFVTDGVIGVLGGEEGDAQRVAALRWAPHEGCERFVIDLVTEDGAPATASGLVQAEIIRDLGVVRLRLAEAVTGTAVADTAFGGRLAGRAFVVRSLEAGLFVDLHLLAPATARSFVLSSPGRVVVDLQSGGPPLPSPAPSSGRVVVLSPRGGSATYPLDVTGYARTFEANVLVRVRQGGRVEAEGVTTAADWTETWGEFTLDLEQGPEGPAELFVGEESAQDGSEEGVVISLE
ncbi:MAG: Gmad2 immunoglobulin-like domain-containing protein [Acidimicrobiia bacterium]